MPIASPSNTEPLLQNDETMKYRPLGKTGLMVSALSFGCMRLGDDQDLNAELVSSAVDQGVNYFETTRFYCGGQCQQRTAPGLQGKTKGVIVSGKTSISADTTAHSFLKEAERQLDILGVDHFKFFQVGWFGWDRMKHLLKRGGVLDGIRQAKDEGLMQFIGFTGHDSPENFIKCIETGLFDSLTVPYNLINRSYEPTIKRAGELGVGVIAMCPVAGGVLSCESETMKEALNMDLPTTDMAIRFVLSNPDVSTACSGMSSMDMLNQNVRTVQEFDDTDVNFEEMCKGLDRLRAVLGNKFCTGCGYCMPCPQGVNIPGYMDQYRNWKCFGLEDSVAGALQRMPEGKRLHRCTSCGVCEEKCPNDLSIPEILSELGELQNA